MHFRAWPRLAGGFMMLAAAGCTALKDIPRDQYTAKEKRKDVHVETSDGLVYEFDYVSLRGDSLVGYRRRDVEGDIADYTAVPMPLGDISRMSARGVDWRRTSLIGVGAAAVVVAVGLSASNQNNSGSGSSGGGKGGGVP